ncbi:TPA: Csu type fimbrial protein [Legionella pneumophila]
MNYQQLLTKSMLFLTSMLIFSSKLQAIRCWLTTPAIAFTYNAFNTSAATSTASLSYKCNFVDSLTSLDSQTVSISLSTGNSGSYSSRYMVQSSQHLNYNLYLDSANTQIWGNGSGGSVVYGPNSPANNQTITVIVYGTIPISQSVAAGTSYTDTITATLHYSDGESVNSSFKVTASVASACTITSTPVNFGNYNPVLGPIPSYGTGTVSIACVPGLSPTITLGLGNNASGNTRRMANGSNTITYELYQPSTNSPGAACAYSTVWGTTGTNIFTPTSPTNISARSYNICGKVATAQSVPATTYTDSITAIVTY